MKNDLMRLYREVTARHEYATQTEAYEAIINHEAPRFYIDARWAHQRIAPMLRGDRSRVENANPLIRQMYEDLYDVVIRLSQKERFWGKKLNYILQFAVLEPAPRFYISVTRMGQIFLDYMRKRDKVRWRKVERPYLRKKYKKATR